MPSPPSARRPSSSFAGVRPHWRRHPLVLTLLLSLLLHGAGLFVLGFGLRPVASVAVAAEPSASNPLRFELVDTPESAQVDQPRTSDSRFFSNRNTRSQQPDLDPDRAATGAPRIDAQGEGHDLRPVGTAPRLGMPSPPAAPPSAAVPPSPAAPPSSKPDPQTERSREPSPVRDGIRIHGEPAPDAPPEETRRPTSPKTPPTPRSQPSPPAPSARAADEPVPPTALELGDTFQPGKPSLSPAEQDLLAQAEAQGEFSFEATKHFFAEYFFGLRDEIWRTWVLLLRSRYKSVEPSKAVLEFLIQPDGRITDVSQVGAVGDSIFPLVCGLAVRNAAPFDPVPFDAVPQLPESARKLPWRVRVTFNYD